MFILILLKKNQNKHVFNLPTSANLYPEFWFDGKIIVGIMKLKLNGLTHFVL